MKSEDIVVIDVETSGPDVFENDLLSLYMCSASGEESVEIFVKYSHDISWGSIGRRYFSYYRDEWESKAENVDSAMSKINMFFDSFKSEAIVLSGHNVAFDYYFLKKLASISSLSLSRKLSHRLVDTHSIIAMKVMKGEMPQYALKPHGAAELFGLPTDQKHLAKNDALLSKKIFLKLLGNY